MPTRHEAVDARLESTIRLLPYQAPYDWDSILSAFRAHQLPHLEAVDSVAYERVIETAHGLGWFRVEHLADREGLRLEIFNTTASDSEKIVAGVRRMFDLDADPAVIGEVFEADPYLSALWKRYPGMRVARSWDGFETLLTTILGQLVSVSFGRVLTDELMRAAGNKKTHPKSGEKIYLFPTAKRILSAALSSVRTSEARRTALRCAAELRANGNFRWEQLSHEQLRATLRSIPGVGAWTSEYVAMRGFHDDNAFPATDYGLKQELKRHTELHVDRVRPWRAYAATALWKSFSSTKGLSHESVI